MGEGALDGLCGMALLTAGICCEPCSCLGTPVTYCMAGSAADPSVWGHKVLQVPC